VPPFFCLSSSPCRDYPGDHGADFLRGKRTSYEGGLRIPLILRWPGHAKPQVRQELVSTVDLMPTLLAATAAPAVPGLAGRALQPLLGNGSAEWRSHLFTEYHTHAAAANYHPQHASILTELQKQLTTWREQTQDPLLDPQKLERLTAEITVVRSKSDERASTWGYPDYFFGKEPPKTTMEPAGKKRKKGLK
jgi:arylsulfatase A-like enzyme